MLFKKTIVLVNNCNVVEDMDRPLLLFNFRLLVIILYCPLLGYRLFKVNHRSITVNFYHYCALTNSKLTVFWGNAHWGKWLLGKFPFIYACFGNGFWGKCPFINACFGGNGHWGKWLLGEMAPIRPLLDMPVLYRSECDGSDWLPTIYFPPFSVTSLKSDLVRK